MTLTNTFDTHIKAISTEQEWGKYKAMVKQPSVYDFVIDKIRAVGDPKFLTQNNKAMKYRVNTDILQGFNKGEIVVAVDCDGDGFPVIPKEHNGIDKEIVERNPNWFEPVEQVQEGDYFKVNGRLYRVMGESEMYNCDWSCKQLIAESSYTSMECPEWDLEDNYYKLSTHEIEQALIKEAKRRGYKEGVKINIGNIGEREKYEDATLGFLHKFEYDKHRDILKYWEAPELNIDIYNSGNWAEIVDQTPHIEINGKQIEVEDGTVKISCGDTIEEETFKCFYAVVNKYNLDVRRNGEEINEQLRQIWDEMPQRRAGFSIEIDASDIAWDRINNSNYD